MVRHAFEMLQRMILNLIKNLEFARCHPHNLIALGLKTLTFSRSLQKKGKNRVKLGPKLRSSNLLAVKCLYGGTSLCKLEVQSIFAILVRKGFITQSKMYDGAFLQK